MIFQMGFINKLQQNLLSTPICNVSAFKLKPVVWCFYLDGFRILYYVLFRL